MVSKRVHIGKKDEFTGSRIIQIKDPEFWMHSGIKINPYLLVTTQGESFLRMRVRIGANSWVDGEYISIKSNGYISTFKLGSEIHSETLCSDSGCTNYQYYDLLIDETLLQSLAHSIDVKMRITGAYQLNDQLSSKRQLRIRDLHTYILMARKVNASIL